MFRKLKSIVNDKTMNPEVEKSKTAAVAMSLAKVPRPNQYGQGAGVTHGDREKENQVPPILMAGLISTA